VLHVATSPLSDDRHRLRLHLVLAPAAREGWKLIRNLWRTACRG
jgi:hypothetical protein